jgi:hypothetical protein
MLLLIEIEGDFEIVLSNLYIIGLIGGILSFYFLVVEILQGFLDNSPYLGFLIPKNWHREIRIYIFTDRKIQDLGCQHLSVSANPIDSNAKLSRIIPFKLCVPKGEKEFKKTSCLEIKFSVSEDNEIHVIEYDNVEHGNTIKIKESELWIGCQKMYYIKITRNYDGVDLQLNVESKFLKKPHKSDKPSKMIKPHIVIDGLERIERNSIEVKFY